MSDACELPVGSWMLLEVQERRSAPLANRGGGWADAGGGWRDLCLKRRPRSARFSVRLDNILN
jgi:hypothetical protein